MSSALFCSSVLPRGRRSEVVLGGQLPDDRSEILERRADTLRSVQVLVQTTGARLDRLGEPGRTRSGDVLGGLHEVEGGAVVLDLEGGFLGYVGNFTGFLGGDLRRFGVLLQRLLVCLYELGIGLVLVGARIQLAGCSLQRSERRLLVLGVE